MSYDPNIALAFFKLFGSSESVKTGEIIFAQGQKANRLLLQHDKMYLLVAGTVNIQIAANTIARIKPGEIFGEITPLIQSERTASAVADGPCTLISLNEKQFVAGLKQKPEFALMFMTAMVNDLRQTISETTITSVSAEDKNSKQAYIFDAKILRDLVDKLGENSIIRVPAKRIVFQKGGAAMFMYVILEGHVIASIDGKKIVERSGPGGVIGEIALLDQKQRVADVIAETNCSLLPINRQTFLDLVKTQPAFGISLLRALASRLYSCRTRRSYAPPNSLFNGF